MMKWRLLLMLCATVACAVQLYSSMAAILNKGGLVGYVKERLA